MSSYKKLLEIKNDCRFDHFVLALGYFFDIGYQGAKNITDKHIDSAKGNGIMTRDFVQWLMREAKEIADSVTSAIDVVQFCEAEDIFDIRYYANKIPYSELEDMVKERLCCEDYDTTKEDELQKLCNLYDCDPENFEMLGFSIPEEEE